MPVNRRFARRVLLTASLGAGIAITAAGCGGSSPAAPGSLGVTASPTAPPSASASASGSAVNAALLASVTGCLRSHGLAVADGALLKQVKVAFTALPLAEQQRDFTACGPLLPATIRQKVAQRIADEEAARPAASP